jgi:hypothetical protein
MIEGGFENDENDWPEETAKFEDKNLASPTKAIEIIMDSLTSSSDIKNARPNSSDAMMMQVQVDDDPPSSLFDISVLNTLSDMITPSDHSIPVLSKVTSPKRSTRLLPCTWNMATPRPKKLDDPFLDMTGIQIFLNQVKASKSGFVIKSPFQSSFKKSNNAVFGLTKAETGSPVLSPTINLEAEEVGELSVRSACPYGGSKILDDFATLKKGDFFFLF